MILQMASPSPSLYEVRTLCAKSLTLLRGVDPVQADLHLGFLRGSADDGYSCSGPEGVDRVAAGAIRIRFRQFGRGEVLPGVLRPACGESATLPWEALREGRGEAFQLSRNPASLTASILHREGQPVGVLQAILRHKSPATTTRYLHGLGLPQAREALNSVPARGKEKGSFRGGLGQRRDFKKCVHLESVNKKGLRISPKSLIFFGVPNRV